MQVKRILLILAASLTGMGLLFSLNSWMRRAASAELALTEGTRAAVAASADEMQQLTLSLEKLLVSGSDRQRALLLTDVALSADRASRSLSALPDAQGERAAVLAFLSSLTERAKALAAGLAAGQSLSAADRAALTDDLNGARLLQTELDLALQSLLTGTPLTSALPASEVAAPAVSAPSTWKALTGEAIGSGKALQIAKEFVGVERVTSVSHAPDTSGAVPTYGVTVRTGDLQLNLEVTRQGGKVLMMSPETAAFPVVRTVTECTQAALSFLQSRGFPAMEAPYYQVYDGLCVLTCVYAEQGVLVWPDRVLVQVRMDTGEVVGIEASKFWQHHTPRRLTAPLLTKAEARLSLAPDSDVRSARLCIIDSGSQERLCWQFTLLWEDDTYLSCIDAITGAELLLEKVIQLENGSIAA